MVLAAGVLLLMTLPGVLELRLSTAAEALRELASLAWRALFSFCASEREEESWSARACVLARSASRIVICFWRERESWEIDLWVEISFLREAIKSSAARICQHLQEEVAVHFPTFGFGLRLCLVLLEIRFRVLYANFSEVRILEFEVLEFLGHVA